MGSAKKVLVVDDEKDIADFLRQLLEDNGYRVETACNGMEAWGMIEHDSPDLILLDLAMPEETGTGLYRKLRHKKEVKDIPVVVISGLAGRDVAVSRSVVVLDKPFEEERVLEEVRKALAEREPALH